MKAIRSDSACDGEGAPSHLIAAHWRRFSCWVNWRLGSNRLSLSVALGFLWNAIHFFALDVPSQKFVIPVGLIEEDDGVGHFNLLEVIRGEAVFDLQVATGIGGGYLPGLSLADIV